MMIPLVAAAAVVAVVAGGGAAAAAVVVVAPRSVYQSDTGVDVISSSLAHTVVRPGEPFNLPAGIAIAPSGDIEGYVS